jgi:hypothetical protein
METRKHRRLGKYENLVRETNLQNFKFKFICLTQNNFQAVFFLSSEIVCKRNSRLYNVMAVEFLGTFLGLLASASPSLGPLLGKAADPRPWEEETSGDEPEDLVARRAGGCASQKIMQRGTHVHGLCKNFHGFVIALMLVVCVDC